MRNAGLDEAEAGIKIARRNTNNLRYADNTALMAESEELKSLLMKAKEQSEKVGLKLSIQKTKIMATGPITSWQIDGETIETVTDFICLSSINMADGDCSHEIKRCLLLGRKAMTNLDSKAEMDEPRVKSEREKQISYINDLDSIPGLGKSSGEGNGYPLQYSCLENSKDRGPWWATLHEVTRVRHNFMIKPPPQ